MNLKLLVAGLALLAIMGKENIVSATPVNLDVRLDTSPLVTGVTGPYFIEFQFIDGDGLSNNSVTLTNFSFGGGAAIGTPTIDGGASGNLFTGVDLADSFFFNAFFQEFIPGNLLTFSVLFDTPAFAQPVPDRLTFAILNGSLFEIPTTGPGNELLGLDFQLPLLLETFPGANLGNDPLLSAPTVSTVPEPGTIYLALAALAVLGLKGQTSNRSRVQRDS